MRAPACSWSWYANGRGDAPWRRGAVHRQHDVERVHTWIDQSIIGDMLVETQYGGYKDFNSVYCPKDGWLSIARPCRDTVTANAAVDITVPSEVRAAPVAPPTVNAQKLGDGVFWVTGGTHHSLAVEMRDRARRHAEWRSPRVGADPRRDCHAPPLGSHGRDSLGDRRKRDDRRRRTLSHTPSAT